MLTFSRQLDRLEFNSVIYLIHRASLQQTAVSIVKISMDSITSWLPLRLKRLRYKSKKQLFHAALKNDGVTPGRRSYSEG